MPPRGNLDNVDISAGDAPSVDARPLRGAFVKIAEINTNAATPVEVSIEQIKGNLGRRYPRINEIPEYDQLHTPDEPIYLVGGGPSLKDTVRDFHRPYTSGPIMACGSVHDYLVESGVVPDYSVLCDPDEILVEYIKKANRKTLYLVSSACHPSIFERLKGYNIVVWHCHSDDYCSIIEDAGEHYIGVGGGCTVGLRAMSIAIIFGYSNLHFYGYDSCISDGDHHAYEFETDKEGVGDIYTLRVGFGTPGEKVYKVAGYQMAQADHFKFYYKANSQYFTPTFHGPGLLPDVFKAIQDRTNERLKEAFKRETVGAQL